MNDPRALATRLLGASRYAMPIEEARAHVEARRRKLLASEPAPPPDFAPAEPLPLDDPVHDAPGYAAAFWKRKDAGKEAPPPAERPGRRPGFRVLDGRTPPSDHGDNDP